MSQRLSRDLIRKENDDDSDDKDVTSRKDNLLWQDLDSRRVQKWLIFSKSKVVFGFDKLPVTQRPNMASKSRGFSICFEKVQGWTVPTQILEELESGNYEMSAQLSLSLYHFTSNSFFGSTWMGVSVPIGGGGRDSVAEVIDFEYRDIVYLTSRLTDPQCVAVVEVVVSKTSKSDRIVVSQYGLVENCL